MNKALTLPAAALLSLLASSAIAGNVPGAHFVENFDANEDGAVSLQEATEKRADIFYMFDQNEDGILDSAEYDLFDETRAADHAGEQMGQGQGKGPRGEGMRREVTDLNGDGQVTQEEFLQATETWFTGKDRNGDGVITTDDFGPRG